MRVGGRVTGKQRLYNYVHSATRISVERAFGLLKGRFRVLLHQVPFHDKGMVTKAAIACAVLHNMCIECKHEGSWVRDEWKEEFPFVPLGRLYAEGPDGNFSPGTPIPPPHAQFHTEEATGSCLRLVR